ncbi:hypothetical protein [uncultured Marivita sp.]|jgi:hypothetical protein|uniref:hypothetical protein n=1 Tax=Marivita sp. TaxID=2003365 RepID=UPI000D7A604A|nr:hypothetical protein [uncultured Marivita sp.]PWL35184.1 MAG: hypothetical protein DCO97_10620 [Marivita sp. XM-24bin2]
MSPLADVWFEQVLRDSSTLEKVGGILGQCRRIGEVTKVDDLPLWAYLVLESVNGLFLIIDA